MSANGLHRIQRRRVAVARIHRTGANQFARDLVFIYLFICDVYTGNPIQQRWFKRRPVYILALYTRFTHYIQLTY